MEKKYDLILIETAYDKTVHYNIIQRRIAERLTAGGLKVAVINFLRNNNYHYKRNYDVIDIYDSLNKPPKAFVDVNGLNIIQRKLKKRKNLKAKVEYIRNIFQLVVKFSDNLYVGTISQDLYNYLKLPELKNKKIFICSAAYFNFIFPVYNKLYSPNSIIRPILFNRYLKYKNIKIFVANIPIRNVFINKGFKKENLIYRPEETFNEVCINNNDKLNNNFRITTIGSIRHEKNLNFVIDTLADKQIEYVIAGKSMNEYSYLIDKRISELNNKYISRINKRFTEEEFHEVIEKSHFLLIADKEFSHPGSNGTLLDAITNMRPIIVPDHTHFSYFIDKYNVGLKYETNNKESLLEAIEKAQELGVSYFQKNIQNMRSEFLFDAVSQEFTKNMSMVLNS